MSHLGKVGSHCTGTYFKVLPHQTQQNTSFCRQPRNCPHATEQTLPQFTLSTVRTLLSHCWRHTPVGQHHNKLTTVPRVMGLSQALAGHVILLTREMNWGAWQYEVTYQLSRSAVYCWKWNGLLMAATPNAKEIQTDPSRGLGGFCSN